MSPSLEGPDGLPPARRAFAVLSMWLTIAMAVMDGAIANVALPTIARDLGAAPAASIWVLNAYQLAIVVCLLPMAALGERLGYRRIYLSGVAVFLLGSLACALSPSLPALAAARVLQGVGAAGVMSINVALLRFTYPQAMLGRGIGYNAVVISVASAAGPTVASAILSMAGWPWLFAVNLPFGLLALVIGLFALPEARGGDRPFDPVSALLNLVAFAALIIGAETLGRGELALGAGELVLAVAAGILLVRRELRRPYPLVPIDLLRIAPFRSAIATSFVSFAGQMLALVAMPFHLQGALARSAVETGLLMTPWPIASALAAPIAGRLSDRLPVGLLAGCGLTVLTLGFLLLANLGPSASDFDIAWRMAVCGAGFGFFQSPNNRAIVSAAPRQRSGAAGGMLATGRVLGQTAGAVTMAILFHTSPAPTKTALFTAAAIAAVAATVGFSRLRPERG